MGDPQPCQSTPTAESDERLNPESDPQPPVSSGAKRPGLFPSFPTAIFGDRSSHRKPSLSVAPESPEPAAQQRRQTTEANDGKESKAPSLLPEPLLRASDFGLQVFHADDSISQSISVDIIAVHDLGETSAEAWTDGVGLAPGRIREIVLGLGRGRDASPSSQDRWPPVKRRTAEFPAESKGKNPDLTQTTPDMRAHGIRKEPKDRLRSAEGSARSSSEFERPHAVHWLRDLLSNDIPQSRILAFSYPAPDFEKKTENWLAYVERVAGQLVELVSEFRTATGPEGSPIVFIGYGFGGVIIQKAIELIVCGTSPPEGHFEAENTQGNADSDPHDGQGQDVGSRDEEGGISPGNQQLTGSTDATTPDRSGLPARAIYQTLFLDTPFPEPEHENEHEERLFPANTNVRMCDIIRQIEEHEKDSGILEKVWAGYLSAYDKTVQAIDVTWLYSQAKTRQTDLQPSELVTVSDFRRNPLSPQVF